MAMRSSNKRRLLSQGKVADEEVERKKVEIESLEAENDKLRRQIELMNSQSRHANSQHWTTEQVASAHGDMLKTALKGMTVIKGITRFCQILEHPIVDSLARCLDDDNFVCALAATCTDLVGQRMVMENDDVYNRAALVYVETLSECLRIDFVRERLRQRGETRKIISAFFDGLFHAKQSKLQINDQVNCRDKVTECLLLLHGGDAECMSTARLYGGDVLSKMASFVNQDEVSEVQRANMIKVMILIMPKNDRAALAKQYLPNIFTTANAKTPELLGALKILQL